MITFDECLHQLFRKKVISAETAITESDNENNQRLRISQYAESNLSSDLSGQTKTTAEWGSGNFDNNNNSSEF